MTETDNHTGERSLKTRDVQDQRLTGEHSGDEGEVMAGHCPLQSVTEQDPMRPFQNRPQHPCSYRLLSIGKL